MLREEVLPVQLRVFKRALAPWELRNLWVLQYLLLGKLLLASQLLETLSAPE